MRPIVYLDQNLIVKVFPCNRIVSPCLLSPDPYYRIFPRLVCERMHESATVLDIGAGGRLLEPLRPIRRKARVLTGVDPNPLVCDHPDLDHAICNTLEAADFGDLQFDLAYSYMVIEHIYEPLQFLRKVRQVLKPGAVFIFLTPNACHPFSVCSRVADLLHLRERMRLWIKVGHRHPINDYPAFYRCNTQRTIARLARQAGFKSLDYAYFHSDWHEYWPSSLQWFPAFYDRVLEKRIDVLKLIIVGMLKV